MNATHAHDVHHDPQQQRDGELLDGRRPTSPWLWMALILAMFAAALVWLRFANHEETAPAPIGERMLPAGQAPVASAPAAATVPAQQQTAAANTHARRAAPPVRNRDARPLAGNAMPTYPAAALRSGIQGSVVASLHVDTRGNVTDAAIVSRSGERSRDLDRAVLGTVRDWKFQPAVQEGRTVASVVRVPVDFQTER